MYLFLKHCIVADQRKSDQRPMTLVLSCVQDIKYRNSRDVTTGATGATAVTPKFSDTLTLSQPGGQILTTIAEVEPKFPPWLRP